MNERPFAKTRSGALHNPQCPTVRKAKDSIPIVEYAPGDLGGEWWLFVPHCCLGYGRTVETIAYEWEQGDATA